MRMHWDELEVGIFRLADSCQVYAVRGPEGTVLINAGTGRAAYFLAEIHAGGALVVLLTHHFRDHTHGAIRLQAAGATVWGPYWEREYLVDPQEQYRMRQVWNSYDNRWDRMAPVRPLPIAGWLRDYDHPRFAGLDWEVVPTPGVSTGAVSLLVRRGDRHLAFVGEALGAGGKLERVAPLQYDYNDLGGAVNLFHSLGRLRQAAPDRAFPSFGPPVDTPLQDIAVLQGRLRDLSRIQPLLGPRFQKEDEDDLVEVLPHLLYSKYANGRSHFVISDTGKILALDYGYSTGYVLPTVSHRSNRRPLLHSLRGLAQRFPGTTIDTVLITHHHDDHVGGIPLLQRLYGTRAWAAEGMAEILENPGDHDRCCLWHEPIPLARKLPCGETCHWENIPITLYPVAGHTRFAALICFEVDGRRVVQPGDQVALDDGDGSFFSNHVYRNGLDLGCYRDTARLIKEFRPDLVLSGHALPRTPDASFYTTLEEGARAFDELHRGLMRLGDEDAHFGAESQAAKLFPYRVHSPAGAQRLELRGWVINPFPQDAAARLELIGPEGWEGEPLQVQLGAREQKSFRIAIRPPVGCRCRRLAIALDLCVGDRVFGQVTEALVTLGHPYF